MLIEFKRSEDWLQNTVKELINRRSIELFRKLVDGTVEEKEKLEILLDNFKKYDLPMDKVCGALLDAIQKIQEREEKTES